MGSKIHCLPITVGIHMCASATDLRRPDHRRQVDMPSEGETGGKGIWNVTYHMSFERD
ncbi:hypothetical protein PILCRDRAFT_825355 [Piloderma croceum F 1598]|uniref:Uncharacterized protein n=1 Tax=Piloderma croceum (strain F 1598) TaxID=765440 RepID=A0A0C3BJ39_PILCF|nr:hypothetical protein PILCRDRAFT_825355 [Piloderma croceum F 1598]